MKFPTAVYLVSKRWCVGRNEVIWKIVLGFKHLKHLSPHTYPVLDKCFVMSHCTLFLCRGTVKISPPWVPAFIKFEKKKKVGTSVSLTNMVEIGERSKISNRGYGG